MLNPTGGQTQEKILTIPKSPNFATKERNEYKANIDDAMNQAIQNEKEIAQFKARKFNKKIFERTSKLPEVEKKDKTDFSEFKISKTNKSLKTIEESTKEFKALPLNKKLLQGQLFKPTLPVPEDKKLTEQ